MSLALELKLLRSSALRAKDNEIKNNEKIPPPPTPPPHPRLRKRKPRSRPFLRRTSSQANEMGI